MKKNNSLGFMLIETLLVSTFVLGVLTYLYMQFSALKRSYNDNFKYDTIPALYGIKNLHQYILNNGGYINIMTDDVKKLEPYKTDGYIEFSCAHLDSATTCDSFIDGLEIQKIYLVNDNIFKEKISTELSILNSDDELYHFVKKINFDTEDENNYHLIVKYNDNTFSTINVIM